MTNKIRIKVFALMLVTVFALSACGQKRALYLPEEPTSNSALSDTDNSATSEQPESDEQGKD